MKKFFSWIAKKLGIDGEAKTENLYSLDGRAPFLKSVPFGIQHFLAMFVGNIAPILIVSAVAIVDGNPLTEVEKASLIQSTMIVAGIATLIQMFPFLFGKVGSRLPIIMGSSFTFVSVVIMVSTVDYGYAVGGMIVAGLVEGILGLTAKYWRKFITPVVSGCVVIAIGISLIKVGATSLTGYGDNPGNWISITIGFVTLLTCVAIFAFTKGMVKNSYIIIGLVVGYIVSLIFGVVDFSSVGETIEYLGVFNIPKFVPFMPKFDISTIITFSIVSIVATSEIIGNVSAFCEGALGREASEKEISGGLVGGGVGTLVSSGLFGCLPVTAFSQHVVICTISKVVNRLTVSLCGILLIIVGLFPPISAVLRTIPDPVLGGCTIMIFGLIMVNGINMLSKCDLKNDKNIIIASVSLSVGIGVTLLPNIFGGLNENVQTILNIFADNAVAGVFVISILLTLIIPNEKNVQENA